MSNEVKPRAGTAALPGANPAANAPSMLLPLRFMLVGVLALLAGIGMLASRPDLLTTYHYNQHIIALTHLFVLGWVLTIVMGATYQMVPVALETRLYSERLAGWQFVFHSTGFLGMVATFWTWNMTAVGHFGSLLAFGVVLFVYNMIRTLTRVPRWTVVATAVACSLGWLLIAITAGLVITAGKCVYDLSGQSTMAAALQPVLTGLKVVARFTGRFDQIAAMHAHAHLGAVGVFVMLIVGISYKLLPMFTLSELHSLPRARASLLLLNVGLLISFFAVLMRSPVRLAGVLLVVSGLVVYGLEVLALLRTRKRRNLDWGVRYFLTAIALLFPVSILAAVLAWPGLPLTSFTGQLENLYGFLGFIGVISFAIIGMLYKILPFLIWFRSYSARVGLAKVPSLADLYSSRLQIAGYWSYLAGLALTAVGIVSAGRLIVQVGCYTLALSIAILAVNTGSILSHLLRPRTQPMPGAAANAATAAMVARQRIV